ncbi:MAG: O-antigen ligase family protein [Paludibacter sp.]
MLAAINQSKRDRHLLLKCLFVFALSTIILTILYLFSIQTDNTWENRITIFRNNQNELGLKIAISILILITIMHDNRLKFKKNRYLFYVIILAMLIFMIQTGSRVAFISLFLSLITYFFLRGKNFTLNNLYKLLPVSIIFLFIWQFFLVNTLLIKRIFMTVNEGDISGRDIRWVASLDLISKNPLFGQGETGYARSIVPILDYYSSPHNVMIEILCYTGIVGLIIFLIFLTRTIICGINSYKVDKDIFPVTLLIPIFGMILSGQIIGTKIAWVIFTFIIALPVSKSFNNRLKRRKERILINNNHETLNGEF